MRNVLDTCTCTQYTDCPLHKGANLQQALGSAITLESHGRQHPLVYPINAPYTQKSQEPAKGWECPKCEAVMAPTIDSCINCKGKQTQVDTVPKSLTKEEPPALHSELCQCEHCIVKVI